jgi:hypothetical protein
VSAAEARPGAPARGAGVRVRTGVDPHEDFEGARRTSVTLAAEAANAHRATASAWTRAKCDRHDGRKMGSVRGVLRQGAGIDGRVGATEVARLAGISFRDADAVRIDHARLVVARCHDDLRARVRTADTIEAALRFRSAAVGAESGAGDRQRLASPARRDAAAADAGRLERRVALGIGALAIGGHCGPVHGAGGRAGAGAPRPAREDGYQADESDPERQKTCHAGQASTLRARWFPLSLYGKRHSGCAAPCRTLIGGSALMGVRPWL